MRWRVSATDSLGNNTILSEPEGLVSAIIGHSRHPEFHTLVKEFKSSFRCYGSNGTQDGKRDWIKNIEDRDGPDAVITILVEYAPDNYTFQTLYTGEVGIQTIIEGLELDHYLEFTPVQLGFWRKFISRYDVPVNIQSALSLDAEAVTVYSPETLTLTSQVIRYKGEYRWGDSFTYITETGLLGRQLDWDVIVIDDLRKFTPLKANVPTIVTPQGNIYADVVGIFEAPYDGVFAFDLKTTAGEYNSSSNLWGSYPRNIWIGKWQDWDNRQLLTENIITYGSDFISEFSFSGSINLLKGEQIVIYAQGNNDTNPPDGYDDTFFGEIRWRYVANCAASTVFSSIVLSGTQTIDGVALIVGDIVLVKNQNSPSENGIYVVSAGSWTRHSGLDTASEFTLAAAYVSGGTDNANTAWKQVEDVAVLDTDPVTWQSLPVTDERFRPYPGGAVSNYLKITADTTYNKTNAQGFLQHDIAAMICDRITDPDKFYSELLGSPYTQARTYIGSGSWWNNALIKLIHARGYTLSDKLFSLSFKDFWEGANPMFNLSLGYETIDGVERIVIRTKAEAYDSSSMSVLLSGVQRIKRRYGPDYFNGAKMGASTGKTEDVSGIDDPYSRTAASILKNIGRVFTNLTTWIFQGLTIEQARRTTKIKSADYRYDDNIAVIEVTRTGTNAYQPRLNEDFDSVTNLLNEETRYNKHHTPARFFLRWLDYLSGGLQKYLGTVFRFTGGEGNYDMVSEMVPGSAPDDYDGEPLAENANIPVGTTVLWIPKVFELEHYLTFEEFQTIDDNRNLAIGVSQTYADHEPFFIDDLQFEIMSGQIKVVGKFKNEFDIITVPPSGQIFQGGRTWDATFDFSFGDSETP